MKAMRYEKTPVKGRKVKAQRKFMLSMTTDMDKLSTLNILRYLYNRHDTDIWITAFVVSWAVYFWIRLG